MNAIIFGANGQDGRYLTALLKEKGVEVIAINRSTPGIQISNFETVCTIVKQHMPTYIFHLAANSTTRMDAWQENHETISTGTFNVLEAVRQYSPGSKVFLSGSGLQFVNSGLPIKETDPFYAGSPYAVSRIHTVYAARFYRQQGLKVYVGYFFNHDSPLRSERHINKKVIEVVKRIAGGSNERLSIGDTSVKKEFGFAGDIVQGIVTLVEQDAVFECVIGTGKAHAIEEWINICFAAYGLHWQEYTDVTPGFTAEYRQLVSNPETILSLGWKPTEDIHSLAKKMLA